MAELTMNKNSRYRQQLLETKNLVGYKGKESQIRCMSSYELKAIKFIQNLVKAGRVKKWNSEETVFEYTFSLDVESKVRRYFMDFTLELNDGRVVFVEVKPAIQLKPPNKPKSDKAVKSYQDKLKEFIKNKDKWKTVQEWCNRENKKVGYGKYSFVLWTEATLKIK